MPPPPGRVTIALPPPTSPPLPTSPPPPAPAEAQPPPPQHHHHHHHHHASGAVVVVEELDKPPKWDEKIEREDEQATARVFVEMVRLHGSGAAGDVPTELVGKTYPPLDKRGGHAPDHYLCYAFSYRQPITMEDMARLSALPRVQKVGVQLLVRGELDVSIGALVVEVKSSARERADAVRQKSFEVVSADPPVGRAGSDAAMMMTQPPSAKRKRASGLWRMLGFGGGSDDAESPSQ